MYGIKIVRLLTKMSAPTSFVNSAFSEGNHTYNEKSQPIRPKPTFQQYVSQSYHAAKQFNSTHSDTMKMVGKEFRSYR